MDRGALKFISKQQLRGHWGLAILVVLVYNLISTASSILVVTEGMKATINLISILFVGVLSVGVNRFCLNLATKRNEPKFIDLFSGFKDAYLKSLGMYILYTILILVGTILLVVPGIIMAVMFSQVFYILAENPEKSILECFRESKEMMVGYKWNYFVLGLSFLGWSFICVFTFGIGFLWLLPYIEVTLANYYLQLKDKSRKEFI